MTHAELCLRGLRWLRTSKGCKLAVVEFVTHGLAGSPDVLGWRGGISHLIEVKISRSDYRRDGDKPHHRAGIHMGRHRWYLTPPGLLDPDEVREHWGLIEATGEPRGRVRVVVDAPLNPVAQTAVTSEIIALQSIVRRWELGVPFDHKLGRFAAWGTT